ncbi:MAG: SpoIIE family protein phosphatase [Porticoccus sp.]|jgi:sigma-B regulation protein RsbU (phosphoserine phosphatase)|uniref:PP2C family protein-serine/threonine phosphatase n=1 Tax=Porticoccus sp. Uisw_050_02 TaxID=3230978 RepID=UPI001DC06346|nr:SpoIIE family protein phosphatase [Porticoccus sp.]|tara:strand:+ start:6066 stop:7244 length:1179 start_codon:yes stop_codon:yes gene_type:complete
MSIKGDLFIVSDSLDNCRILEEDLVDTDWQVTQFEDISEAIAAIKTKRPAVVALDLPLDLMQDKFFALLSLDSATAYIVILPEVNPREVAKFFHQNASDVLIKPFAENRFQEAIERASEFKSLIRQNLEYRQQLEQANRELNDSLHLLELDQIAGSQIQNSLLPPTPLQKDKYEIAYRISPSLYLSGDFVGYNILYDRYLVFYVADVSGHGSSSAFLTVLLKFVFSRLLKRHKANKDLDAMSMAPKGFIEHINRQIMALDLDKHLTIFAGSLDMQKNILRYSVASHMPMPVLISNGGIQTLKGRGKPVGIFSKCSWEVQEIELPDKFLLALVSDGVLELLPGKSLKEKEKFISDSVSQSDESIEDICERLGVSKTKKDAPDDVTVLTLRKGE